MAILFIAVIIGIAISTMRHASDKKIIEYGNLLNTFFTVLNEIMFYKIVQGVLLYAPVGIFFD
nr:hypothetical protein [Virgibacillus proomii]